MEGGDCAVAVVGDKFICGPADGGQGVDADDGETKQGALAAKEASAGVGPEAAALRGGHQI